MEGRTDELARCEELLAGGTAGVLLVGPAGVGKSRLAIEVGEARAREGHLVERLAGSSAGAGLPLGAVAPLLPADVVDVGLPALLLLRRALTERADGRPVTLVVDDAHLLDDASALLVHQLVAGGDVEVVATQRSGTLAPEPVTRLWRDQLVTRVEVGPLDRAAVATLVAAIADGHPVTPADVDEVWRLSEGNPLYVREVVLAAIDHGATGDRLLAEGATGGASRLTDLVRLRVGDLDDAGRDALLHIAFGEPLGPGELDHVAPPDVVDALDERGLLTTSVDGKRLSVRLVHPLYGEVLRAGVSPLQARRVRRRLAEALQATGARRREDVVRLAAWAVDGGLDVEPALLAAAARTARFSLDFDLAERLARRALEVAPDFLTAQVLFDVLYERGEVGPLNQHFEVFAGLAADDEQRALVGMARAIAAFWRESDEPKALAFLDEVDQLTPSVFTEEARALRASFLSFRAHPEDSIVVATPFVDRPPDRVGIQAALALSFARRSLGQPATSLAVIDTALAAYATLGEQGLLISNRVLGTARISVLADLGRFDEADAVAVAARTAAEEMGDTSNLALLSISIGWVQMMRGRVGAAAETYETGGRGLLAVNHPGMARWAWANAGLARALGGDAVGAAAAIDRVEEIGDHPALVFESSLDRARAWTAWLEGRPTDARALLAEGITSRRELGDVMGEVLCAHDLARAGWPEDAAATFDRRSDMEGDLYALMADHVAALAGGDRAALGDVTERFASMGAWLWAGEAAVATADAARRDGDQRAAAGWDRRAAECRERCDTVRTPGLLPTPGPVPLTRREREVAILAAQGLSSREVGERLYVGHRTVESHLARIYTKLGIRSRAELSRLFGGGTEAIID